MIKWWSIEFGESAANAAADAVRSGCVSQGSIVRNFESALGDFLAVPHVIACSSGTSSLTLALAALGVGPGDEIIMPARSWIATAHAVHMLGANPVFVPSLEGTTSIDVSQIEPKIGHRTKAIIAVHMNGRASDMAALQSIADARGIHLIEDAAQAIGSRNLDGNLLGTLADIGCFSLSVTKLLSAGQGGFCVTRSDEIATCLRNMRTHGLESTINVDSWVRPGFNFRFTDVAASIGMDQLTRLEKNLDSVRYIQDRYTSSVNGLKTMTMIEVKQHNGEVGPYVEISTSLRNELIDYLGAHGVESRPFFPPMSSAHYWRNSGPGPMDIYGRTGLCLPSGPALEIQDVDSVCQHLSRFDEEYSPTLQDR